MKVLVVCSGNICRSPMTAAMLRRALARDGSSDIEVDSAGTLGIRGAAASREAIDVLAEIGVDLGGHRSRGLLPSDLRRHDVVIAMDHGHLDALRALPQGPASRFLLRAFERSAEPESDPFELDDPFGRSIVVYREQREIIARCVKHLALFLRRDTR